MRPSYAVAQAGAPFELCDPKGPGSNPGEANRDLVALIATTVSVARGAVLGRGASISIHVPFEGEHT